MVSLQPHHFVNEFMGSCQDINQLAPFCGKSFTLINLQLLLLEACSCDFPPSCWGEDAVLGLSCYCNGSHVALKDPSTVSLHKILGPPPWTKAQESSAPLCISQILLGWGSELKTTFTEGQQPEGELWDGGGAIYHVLGRN